MLVAHPPWMERAGISQDCAVSDSAHSTWDMSLTLGQAVKPKA